MKRMYWMKGCLLLLLCLPLQGIAQYDTAADTVAVNDTYTEPVAEEANEIPVYEMRKVPDVVVKELKSNKKLQYRDVKATPPDNRIAELLLTLYKYIRVIRIVIMILLVAGLGFLVYWFMKSNGMSIFRKPLLVEGLGQIEEEELHSGQEYEEKIKAAVAAGDTRQAIRWWYLYTLFQLAGKEMIVAGREKTNNDYLRSMRSSSYYKKFATLTLDYEYIWYGGFEVSEENFRNINQEFRDFNNAIGKTS